ELHQTTAESSDIGFLMAMVAHLRPPATTTGVLADDRDADLDALAATLVAGPYHGTLDFASDGNFAYVPDAGFTGVDQFTYRVRDGQLDSNLALVTINVGGVNEPPSAIDDRYVTWGGQPLSVPAAVGVLGNDFDPNADTLTVTV